MTGYPSEVGSGPLTKENVSLAGIHIGDTQEQVRRLYGEPTTEQQVNSTPYLGWYYKGQDLYVTFYRENTFAPVEGVVDIKIEPPSKLRTNTGIGIGDSLESILNNYDEVYEFAPIGVGNSQVQDVFIVGVNKWYANHRHSTVVRL